MRALGVIPARFGAERFPGKPLQLISGRPMIQWVVEAAKKCTLLDEVIVATDHEGIAESVKELGVRSVMTDSGLPSGSDRVWAAVRNEHADVILNIQGDEPLLNPDNLALLIAPFKEDEDLEMATLGHACYAEDLVNPNVAKIVVNKYGEALYFSRYGIPYSRQDAAKGEALGNVLRHIGLYAYRRGFLQAYCEEGACGLENSEGLEQLRALYMGARIRVVECESESIGVDTPEDLVRVEQILSKRKK